MEGVVIYNPRFVKSYVLDLAIFCLRKHWPDAIIETGEGKVFPAHYRVPYGIISKFFVYKTAASRETWLSIPNTMVQLVCDEKGLKVTVDSTRDKTMASFLEDLHMYLRMSIGWSKPWAAEVFRSLL